MYKFMIVEDDPMVAMINEQYIKIIRYHDKYNLFQVCKADSTLRINVFHHINRVRNNHIN